MRLRTLCLVAALATRAAASRADPPRADSDPCRGRHAGDPCEADDFEGVCKRRRCTRETDDGVRSFHCLVCESRRRHHGEGGHHRRRHRDAAPDDVAADATVDAAAPDDAPGDVPDAPPDVAPAAPRPRPRPAPAAPPPARRFACASAPVSPALRGCAWIALACALALRRRR